jgi:hypothetical protein
MVLGNLPDLLSHHLKLPIHHLKNMFCWAEEYRACHVVRWKRKAVIERGERKKTTRLQRRNGASVYFLDCTVVEAMIEPVSDH